MERKEDKEIFNRIYNSAMYQMILQDFVNTKKGKDPIGTGSEGEAYTYGEDYIVKSFFRAVHGFEDDRDVFIKYFKEMQKFKREGVNFPDYYAWLINNNPNFQGKSYEQQYNYYILEERIKGTQFCPDYIEHNYPMFEDFCSEKDFNDFLKTPEQNVMLMKEIVKTYISYFVRVNEIFESMPEDKLEKLVKDTFDIYLKGMYSEPDLFGSNVFFTNNEKDITLIDTRIVHKNGRDDLEEGYNTPRAFLEIFRLFEKDDIPLETVGEYGLDKLDPSGAVEIFNLIDKNKEICKSAMRKIVKVMKKIEFDRGYVTNQTFIKLLKSLENIFGKEESKIMVDEIQRSFN